MCSWLHIWEVLRIRQKHGHVKCILRLSVHAAQDVVVVIKCVFLRHFEEMYIIADMDINIPDMDRSCDTARAAYNTFLHVKHVSMAGACNPT